MQRRIALALVCLVAMVGVAGASVPIDGGVPLVAPDGPAVTATGNTSVAIDNGTFPSDNRVRINVSEGAANFTSNGPSNVTVHKDDIAGNWTNVSALDVAGARLDINPDDKPAANISGEADTFAFRGDMAVDDGRVDFVYSGASGSTTVTVRNITGDDRLKAVDQDGTTLAVAASTGGGVVTFADMPNSEHNVTIQTADGTVDTNPTDAVTVDPITRRSLIMLFLVAIIGSYLVLATSMVEAPAFRVLGGAFLVVLWGALSLWWTNYVFVDVVNTEIMRSNTPMSLLSLIGGVLVLLEVFRSGAGLIAE